MHIDFKRVYTAALNQMSGKPKRVTISTLAIFLAAAGAVLMSSCAKNGVAEAEGTAQLPAGTVASGSTGNLSRGLVLTAEFKPYQEVEVMAKVAGYIKQINVDIGDRVQQNQVLATLEIPEMDDDLRRAKAAVERSNAEVARANDEIQRAEAAHAMAELSFKRLAAVSEKKPGLVAEQEIDDARSKDLVAEAQVSAAKSALAVSKEQVRVNGAEVQKIQTMMEYTRVLAPFAGIVTQRYADQGSMIQAGTASQTQARPVVRISQNSLLRLILPVPESSVPTVHIGQKVDVRVPTLNRSFPGQVKRFADKVALATRTMDTEVDVPTPELVLIPGMYAEVNLSLAQRNRILMVPVTAVDMASDDSQSGAGKNGQVMVVTPQTRLEPRRIALGLETADKIEVRSGLNDGDMVVIGSRTGLQPGQEVQPKVTEMTASN